MRIDWHGIFPALSTPTDDQGVLDEDGLRNEVQWAISVGAHGVIVSIMAGEFHKFSDEERKRCYEITVEAASGKVPVLAGTSHSGTEVAIMESLDANQFGYDFCTELPGDLTPYDAIFIPIGWYFC